MKFGIEMTVSVFEDDSQLYSEIEPLHDISSSQAELDAKVDLAATWY